jgi:hypothetical protein
LLNFAGKKSELHEKYMDFTIKLEIKRPGWELSLGDKTLLLGSCFATNMGARLQENRLSCVVNPFGVLYNPESIRMGLLALLEERVEDSCYFQHDGLWRSWLHDTQFAAPTREECEAKVERAFREAVAQLHEVNVLVITFGTNRCYRHLPEGRVVSNCHKVPQREFREESLTVGEIVERWQPLLARLFERRPQLHVVFTVSPYRYAKYGYHESTLSKSVLHLAEYELQQRFPEHVSYFPAYEILIDELRDYRFYKEDMLHPADQAVEYIWQRFLKTYADKELMNFITDFAPVRRALQHRPLHPESDQYCAFLTNIREKVVELSKKYPNFAVQKVLGTIKI